MLNQIAQSAGEHLSSVSTAAPFAIVFITVLFVAVVSETVKAK